ncbi:MAG TPA: hypothetical protein VKM55_14980 [Candidatus Lokiarchaeia archaeon]|nr:hypothetical protein [Candidatus Lokiarchaeia archaeon]
MVEESGIVRITVEARDQPGELIRILKPLSEHNANIQGVFHDHSHDADRPLDGSVPVEITFTFDPLMSEEDKRQRIEKIEQDLAAENIQILDMSIEQIETTKTEHVILIGPIFETDIQDSIIQITSTGARIADMQAAIAGPDTPQSTVMFKIEYEQDAIHSTLLEKLSDLSQQKNLKYITS